MFFFSDIISKTRYFMPNKRLYPDSYRTRNSIKLKIGGVKDLHQLKYVRAGRTKTAHNSLKNHALNLYNFSNSEKVST